MAALLEIEQTDIAYNFFNAFSSSIQNLRSDKVCSDDSDDMHILQLIQHCNS